MKTVARTKSSLQKLLFRVTALVISRLRRKDIREVLERLETLPRQRAYAEVGGVLLALFLLALLAASFGIWGLFAYFAAIVIFFR
ncbi:hypothetical protein [uncultured Roseobacter sp.]|uniref:hypothetical protein n=1 Tax=uncultured Roseobacter sp. TaxID=114847 RepID=UPI00261C9C87|nr:hypothetical protein [uncultured Roseobacter sp.]